MKPLICQCCGGQIDPVTMKCRYCDTVYVDEYEQIRRIKQENNSIKTQLDKDNLYREALKSMRDYDSAIMTPNETEESAIMTPNEVRKKIGLNPIADFGITAAEAAKSFMNLGRCGYMSFHHN